MLNVNQQNSNTVIPMTKTIFGTTNGKTKVLGQIHTIKGCGKWGVIGLLHNNADYTALEDSAVYCPPVFVPARCPGKLVFPKQYYSRRSWFIAGNTQTIIKWILYTKHRIPYHSTNDDKIIRQGILCILETLYKDI